MASLPAQQLYYMSSSRGTTSASSSFRQRRRLSSKFNNRKITLLLGLIFCICSLLYSLSIFHATTTKISYFFDDIIDTFAIPPPITTSTSIANITSNRKSGTTTSSSTVIELSSTYNEKNKIEDVEADDGSSSSHNDKTNLITLAVQNALRNGFPQRTKPIPQNRWELLSSGNDNCFTTTSRVVGGGKLNRQYLTKQQKRKLKKLVFSQKTKQHNDDDVMMSLRNNNTDNITATTSTTMSNDSTSSSSILMERQRQQQQQPYVMIIGAQKSGTSALASYLYQHPYAIKGTKEYHFFLDKIDDDLYSTIYYYDHHHYHRRVPPNPSSSSSSNNNNSSNDIQVGILSDLAYEEYYHVLTSQPQRNDKIPDLHAKTTSTTTAATNNGVSTTTQSSLLFNKLFMLDATPNYMFGSDRVPKRIMCITPWVKIIVLLRNPIDRAYSQYNMNVARYLQQRQQKQQSVVNPSGSTTSTTSTTTDISDANTKGYISFEEYVELDLAVLNATGVLQSKNQKEHASSHRRQQQHQDEDKAWSIYTKLGVNSPIGRGLYSIQLRHWLEEFRRVGKSIENDLLVLQTEQLKVDRNGTYMKVLQFLNLPLLELEDYPTVLKGSSSYRDDSTTPQSSLSSSLPPATMSETTRQKLQDIFEPYNSQLYNLLGKSEWKDVWK